jgi:hypothetical protein
MLNHVLNFIQYWFSISFCPKGEILKSLDPELNSGPGSG